MHKSQKWRTCTHAHTHTYTHTHTHTHIHTLSQVAQQDLQYLEILGHGSGGTVYRTFHQMSKIIMAVKVLALDATPEEQKQIKSELEILHKVRNLSFSLSLSLDYLNSIGVV